MTLTPATAEQEDLWAFALAFYACPGVAPACLRCQDEAGADVNILLFSLWQAASGIAVDTATFAAIDADTRDWRQLVVQKLRAIRRHLKPPPTGMGEGDGAHDLREMVKSAELEAERQHLHALATYAGGSQTGLDCAVAARANLVAYQAATGLDLPPDALENLLKAFADALASDFRG